MSKLPAQRVIEAARAYLHGKVGDGSYPDFLLAVRAYEQADDPGVVVSGEVLRVLVRGSHGTVEDLERWQAASDAGRAALEAK